MADAVRTFDLSSRVEEICDFLNGHGGRKTAAPGRHPQRANGAVVSTPASQIKAPVTQQRDHIWKDRPFHPSVIQARRRLGKDAPYALTDPASPEQPSKRLAATHAVTARSFHSEQLSENRRPSVDVPNSTAGMSAAQRKRQRDLVEAEREGLTVGELLARRRAKAARDLELHRVAVSRGITVKQLRRWIDRRGGSNSSQ